MASTKFNRTTCFGQLRPSSGPLRPKAYHI